MKKLTGQCMCGDITYEINGEIGTILNCHCLKCRRWHGSAYRTRTVVKTENFKWLRGEHLLSKYPSSKEVLKTFCSKCGSALISILLNDPEHIGLPMGGLEQDPGNRPEMHIFVGSKAPWHEIIDKLPQHDTWPPEGIAGLAHLDNLADKA